MYKSQWLFTIVIDFQTPYWNVHVVCFILWWTCQHKLWGPCSCWGSVLQLLLRSQHACHHPIHTSIRPPTCLSVTARSPTSLAKPFIDDLVQVLASTWNTAHVHKQVKYRAACIVCVSECVCVKGLWRILLLCRLIAITSLLRCLCGNVSGLLLACNYLFIVKESKLITQ